MSLLYKTIRLELRPTSPQLEVQVTRFFSDGVLTIPTDDGDLGFVLAGPEAECALIVFSGQYQDSWNLAHQEIVRLSGVQRTAAVLDISPRKGARFVSREAVEDYAAQNGVTYYSCQEMSRNSLRNLLCEFVVNEDEAAAVPYALFGSLALGFAAVFLGLYLFVQHNMPVRAK
ncbi:hypothetical protein SS50377_22697 [Spironucleus salmonicida]|uniref:Transmembrane protein n=2 Tax=Spironucleus salmonicida TaxID=348837 RepID=V6LV81_9EUKA|nr:hypothetical protein SS50377_22690 [Spironucleus salmonicida]KAH0575075.1 hypothetical protein SS50377_22697 [Spironucleus salmonicida]|eukprot:EST48485.1 Hypothetical protein SS50377_11316 [Spironucleus salmonicida]